MVHSFIVVVITFYALLCVLYPYPWITYPYLYPSPNPSVSVSVILGYGYRQVRVQMTLNLPTGYPCRTLPRTAQDRVKPVLCGPSIFGNIRTGPVHGPSPDEPRTGTGPDFKVLDVCTAEVSRPYQFGPSFHHDLNLCILVSIRCSHETQ